MMQLSSLTPFQSTPTDKSKAAKARTQTALQFGGGGDQVCFSGSGSKPSAGDMALAKKVKADLGSTNLKVRGRGARAIARLTDDGLKAEAIETAFTDKVPYVRDRAADAIPTLKDRGLKGRAMAARAAVDPAEALIALATPEYPPIQGLDSARQRFGVRCLKPAAPAESRISTALRLTQHHLIRHHQMLIKCVK